MAIHLTNLTIFVSGPSDAEAEKSALRTVVGYLADVLEKSHRITLRLVSWPDTFRPGVGSDPQSVLNQQIGTYYDIYIGVLGSRFGTPTPRAESGTEEEFEAALQRFRNDTTSVRVMFYFKRTEQDPFMIDLDQIQKVRNFRDRLSTQGVLYKDFKDTSEFIELARKHIHNLILDEWKDDRWSAIELARSPIPNLPTRTSESQAVIPTQLEHERTITAVQEDSEDELGLFELVKDIETGSQALAKTISRIGTHTTGLTEKIEQRTAEINGFVEQFQHTATVGGNREKQTYLSRAIEIVNDAARDIEQYAADLSPEIKQFQAENRLFFEKLGRAMSLQRESDIRVDQLQHDKEALQTLLTILDKGRENTIKFQSTIARIPAMTGKLKKARKRASTALGELIAELQFSLEKGKSILPALEELRQFPSNSGESS